MMPPTARLRSAATCRPAPSGSSATTTMGGSTMSTMQATILVLLSATAVALAAQSTPAPPSEGTRVRTAAISFVPTKFDLERNAGELERLFRQAAAGGAKIAVAPEGALEGYVVNEIIEGRAADSRMKDVAVAIDHPIILRFRRLAADLKMCLVFGFA